MPHVILAGPVTVEDIWLAFEPTSFTEKGNRFKAEEAFLSVDKRILLVRSVTVERGFTKQFYVRFVQKPEGVSVGLDLLNSPEKSDGVKRLLGLFAWKIMEAEPEVNVATTNIQEFLGEPTL